MAILTHNTKFLDSKTIPEQQVIIEQTNAAVDTMIVKAPLPDGFGTTVGSEYSTPFDTGGANDVMRKALFIKEVSQKPGFRMKKYYANPVPTEISFEMEFFSYYDAYTEVVVPAFLLQAMSVGRTLQWDELKQSIEKFIKGGVKLAGKAVDAGKEASKNFGADFDMEAPVIPAFDDSKASVTSGNSATVDAAGNKILDAFGLVVAPPITRIKFGKTLVLDNCFITHVGIKFSNVLDFNGYPTSCTASITATPQEYPVYDDIHSWFNGGSAYSQKQAQSSTTQKPRQQ